MMATPWLAHVLLRRWPGPPECPQGHLRVPRATCVPPCRTGPPAPTAPGRPGRHFSVPVPPLEPHGTRSHKGCAQVPPCQTPMCPKLPCPESGLVPPPPEGCSRLTKEQDPALKEEKSPRAGWGEALTLLKLDLQHIRRVRRGGRVAGLRVEAGGGRILQGEGDKGKWVPLAQPTSPTSPDLGTLHPPPPVPIPKRGGRGERRHKAAPEPAGAPGTKGPEKSDNFSPQLDLIFFFDAPTAGGGIAAEKQVRQGKVRLFFGQRGISRAAAPPH